MSHAQLSDVQIANLTLLLTIRDGVLQDRTAACCKFALDATQANRLGAMSIQQVLLSAGRRTHLRVISRQSRRSGLAGSFEVDQALGLLLPFTQELLGSAVVVDGLLQQACLLCRDRTVHERATLHVPPLVVRTVTSERILGAAAARLAAHLHPRAQRA